MLKELGARWKTALALLIAVTTALLFSTTTPVVPAPQSQGEAFCPPEQHDNPCISRQQSGEPTAPRAETHALVSPRFGDMLLARQTADAWSLFTLHVTARSRPAGGVYARGPPATTV